MSLRGTVEAIAASYATESKKPLAGNALASTVRITLPAEIEAAVGGASDLLVKASAGNGNWAEVPWAALFEPSVTTSATRGYYPVYLFNIRDGLVHLSLNQGTTKVREEFGNRSPDVLSKRAELMRDRLGNFTTRFPSGSIQLPGGRLSQDYATGHAIGITYAARSLPPDGELAADLTEMIAAYRALIFRGGLDFESPSFEMGRQEEATVEEERKYRAHLRIERNRKAAELAKKFHGTRCQCCGLDFGERYGRIGEGFIEVHHLLPIGLLREGVKVDYSIAGDFAVLCANCHRMIHRMPDASDLTALRTALAAPPPRDVIAE